MTGNARPLPSSASADAGPPIVSPDPATLDAPGCLAEVHRLYRLMMALPYIDRPETTGQLARVSPAYLGFQRQIYALSLRHWALTAETILPDHA